MDDGTVTAHGADPTMVGRSIYELTDASGKKFGEEIHAAAVEGEFNVVEYVWPRPGETVAVSKTTYVTEVSDQVCVVGYYNKGGAYLRPTTLRTGQPQCLAVSRRGGSSRRSWCTVAFSGGDGRFRATTKKDGRACPAIQHACS